MLGIFLYSDENRLLDMCCWLVSWCFVFLVVCFFFYLIAMKFDWLCFIFSHTDF